MNTPGHETAGITKVFGASMPVPKHSTEDANEGGSAKSVACLDLRKFNPLSASGGHDFVIGSAGGTLNICSSFVPCLRPLKAWKDVRGGRGWSGAVFTHVWLSCDGI